MRTVTNKVVTSSAPLQRATANEENCSLPNNGVPSRVELRNAPIRMLRLAQVLHVTGLGKTKIYELQAEGNFPMRVKITSHSVGWVEGEVQAWLARRIAASTPPPWAT